MYDELQKKNEKPKEITCFKVINVRGVFDILLAIDISKIARREITDSLQIVVLHL